MWGLIIGTFIALNVVSTIIILSACLISGRNATYTAELVGTSDDEQVELAIAISKLRCVELTAALA